MQKGAYERFVARFLAKVEQLKVGDGLAAATRMGPLPQAHRVAAIAGFIDDAHQRGATILAGGKALGGKGNFYAPTVIADLPEDSRLMSEEPFGPVAGSVRFKTLDEAIQRANSLP